jgi:hypothetical protein
MGITLRDKTTDAPRFGGREVQECKYWSCGVDGCTHQHGTFDAAIEHRTQMVDQRTRDWAVNVISIAGRDVICWRDIPTQELVGMAHHLRGDNYETVQPGGYVVTAPQQLKNQLKSILATKMLNEATLREAVRLLGENPIA